MPLTKTKIEWTEYSWNVVTGCSPVSDGCDNCYANLMASRFPEQFNDFKVTERPDRLDQPMKLKKPSKIFVCSMGDLFHPDVTDEFLEQVEYIIKKCPQHVFQILTKRPNLIHDYFKELNNVWLGVSVENQKTADERIPMLLDTPAALRFVSLEPLLGEIELYGVIPILDSDVIEPSLDWVIVGCETGHKSKRRPCKIEWVRSIVDQCQNAQVPVFVKQLDIDGKAIKDINKFPVDLQIRQFPGEVAP